MAVCVQIYLFIFFYSQPGCFCPHNILLHCAVPDNKSVLEIQDHIRTRLHPVVDLSMGDISSCTHTHKKIICTSHCHVG